MRMTYAKNFLQGKMPSAHSLDWAAALYGLLTATLFDRERVSVHAHEPSLGQEACKRSRT